jgi:hypothetical protein
MKNTMRDKHTRNEKGQLHGPFQDYRSDGRPWETSHYVNGVEYGYCEVTSSFKELPSDKYYFCR